MRLPTGKYLGARPSGGGGSPAAVVNHARAAISPVVSFYVNDYNAPGRATYRRAGFREVGEFMSVLF